MMSPRSVLFPLALAGALSAQAPQVQISIGVRETAAGGGSFTNIGDDGGTVGGIEWINLDGQTLTLDGTWQTFTFDLANDPVTAFAGTTANGVLEGSYGVLEHVRILNANGITDPITIWIDDVADTVTPGGTTTFGTFEGYMDGDEVMFQEPDFSGSTSGNVVAGTLAVVENAVVPSAADRWDIQFIDNSPTRWVRMTTFVVGGIQQGNPLIRFDQGSVVTFRMRGGECQLNLGGQGPGNVIANLCGTGLNFNESSIYTTAGAPANGVGALLISMPNAPDLNVLGGTVVSGAGLLASVPLVADANGQSKITVPGSAAKVTFVLQSLFVDGSLPQAIAFSNAISAQFGL